MSRYRILSFDGGGIRGLLTATLLECLEAARPGFLAKADLCAGVSTGGIIALGMAAGLPPSTVADLYESKAGVGEDDSVLDDIVMLSFGTGFNPYYLAGEESDWGLLQWARPVFDIILDASTGVADYQCARLLGARYHRLNPILPGPIGLDDISQVPLLKLIGEQTDLTSTLDWLSRQYLDD